MSLKLNMSAGEFFELIRPAALVVSALLSTWVLASARKTGFRQYASAAWAIGTLLFPPIVLPVYIVARYFKRSRNSAHATPPRARILIPLAYLAIVLSVIAIFIYQDQNSVDAHLARATAAKLARDPERTIAEYRAALSLENNPHTRKLLALELADAGYLNEALGEFRLAEQGGEPDDLIPFRLGVLLDGLNLSNQAALEYDRFLLTEACTQELPNRRCAVAQQRLEAARKTLIP